MDDLSQALAGLQDIHLPAAAPWWDMAWGWWMLLVLFFVFMYLCWKYQRHIRQLWQAKRAHKALSQEVRLALQNMEENQDDKQVLLAISSLLRRVSLTVFPTEHTAGLIGDDWLHFLDAQWAEHRPQTCFSDENMAYLLKNGVYQRNFFKNEQENVKKLLTLSQTWTMLVIQKAQSGVIQDV